MIVNEMRRDASDVGQNERLGFVLDTFYDRRNGPRSASRRSAAASDGQITDERQYNSDWNPVWDVATGRFDGGWTVESGDPVQVAPLPAGPRADLGHSTAPRSNRWKNEVVVPDAASRRRSRAAGSCRCRSRATLVGLEVPPGSKNLEIKPYAIVGSDERSHGDAADLERSRRATSAST